MKNITESDKKTSEDLDVTISYKTLSYFWYWSVTFLIGVTFSEGIQSGSLMLCVVSGTVGFGGLAMLLLKYLALRNKPESSSFVNMLLGVQNKTSLTSRKVL